MLLLLVYYVSVLFIVIFILGSVLSLQDGGKLEYRRIAVPPHRYTPLKENWMKIFTPVVEQLKLQIRLNLKTRHVELKVNIC